MAGNAAPVEVGLVASLARPGGNVTGVGADLGGDIEGKRPELLKEAVPRISRVAFVAPPTHWSTPAGVTLQATARALGLTLFLAGISRSDVAPAFPLVTRERADAMFVAHGPETYVHRRPIIEFAATSRLPASYAQRESVEDGGFMSYGLRATDVWVLAAPYGDKILKGAKPADLPVQHPTKFELVITLKTAKALGLTIPPSLQGRADQVIQ